MFTKIKALIPTQLRDQLLAHNVEHVVETVPPFLFGTWQRNYIINNVPEYSVDATTNVIWLQTASKFSDIRIPQPLSDKYYNNPKYQSWNDYNHEDLLYLSQNILADAGTCYCDIQNTLNFHEKWNQRDEIISNSLMIDPVNPYDLEGKIGSPTIDPETSQMALNLPIAEWNANISNVC